MTIIEIIYNFFSSPIVSRLTRLIYLPPIRSISNSSLGAKSAGVKTR